MIRSEAAKMQLAILSESYLIGSPNKDIYVFMHLIDICEHLLSLRQILGSVIMKQTFR